MSIGEVIALIKAFGGSGGGGFSGGGVLVVHATASGQKIVVPRLTLDKTFKQIEDGMTSGGVVIVTEASGGSSATISTVVETHKESGNYEVTTYGDLTYSAGSEDGYPYADILG